MYRAHAMQMCVVKEFFVTTQWKTLPVQSCSLCKVESLQIRDVTMKLSSFILTMNINPPFAVNGYDSCLQESGYNKIS